jgi:hypothetical protein
MRAEAIHVCNDLSAAPGGDLSDFSLMDVLPDDSLLDAILRSYGIRPTARRRRALMSAIALSQ